MPEFSTVSIWLCCLPRVAEDRMAEECLSEAKNCSKIAES